MASSANGAGDIERHGTSRTLEQEEKAGERKKVKPEEGWPTEHPYFKRGQCSLKMIGNHCSINGVKIHLGSTYVWHQLLGLICMVMEQHWRQLEDTGES